MSNSLKLQLDDQEAQDVMKQSKPRGAAEEGMRMPLLQTCSEHAAQVTSTHAPLVKSAMEGGAQADGSYTTGIVQLGAIEEYLGPHAGQRTLEAPGGALLLFCSISRESLYLVL